MNCRLCPGALCLRVVFDFGSFRVRGSRRADGGSARGRMAAPEPPAEHDAAYYAQPQPQPVARPTTEASTTPTGDWLAGATAAGRRLPVRDLSRRPRARQATTAG